MPGFLVYRNLPGFPRGNRGTGNGDVGWRHSTAGKTGEGKYRPAQPQAKSSFFISPLQTLQQSKTQSSNHRYNDQKKGVDYLANMLQDRILQADAVIADRSSYVSSGSEHELSSVCLTEMVHEFMENEPLQRRQCGRARCNCDTSNSVGVEVLPSCVCIESTLDFDGELTQILKDFTSGITEVENILLTHVKEAISNVKDEGIDSNECTSFKRSIMNHLRAVGYNAAICKSRWGYAGCFPGGEYDYIDVIIVLNDELQRLIIDIHFAAQFEIARPTDHYRTLLETLPSIFVGKPDRLLQIINVMSTAVKKSLKINGMHLPPWRKPEYIKAKWFSSYRRTTKSIGRHLNSRDDIRGQDFRWGRTMHNEKAEAKHAGEELGIHASRVCYKPFEKGQSAFKIHSNVFHCDEYERPTMLTNWQPPVVDGKASNKDVKIAGLASALMEAGLTTALVQRQITKNHENKISMGSNVAAAALMSP